MSGLKFVTKSFAGGEITTELLGRLDLVKYQTGLRTTKNAITLPHGPATKRAGTEFIIEAFDSTRQVVLFPFRFSANQTAALEFGHQYIRFHISGGTQLANAQPITNITGNTVTIAAHGLSNGDDVYMISATEGGRFHRIYNVTTDTFDTIDAWGNDTTPVGDETTAAKVYTLTSPYDQADLYDLHIEQNADVVTITHPSYAARELVRESATDWSLSVLSFDAPTNAPTDLSVEATVKHNDDKTQQTYVVTTIDEDGITESLPSDPVSVQNNLSLNGNYNTLTWSPVGNATRYKAYKKRGGAFGYIGQTAPTPGTSSASISSISRPGGGDVTVSVTTSSSHGFSNNQLIIIEDTGVATFNGAWIITVTGAATFTYESVTDNNDSAATGTASQPELEIVDDYIAEDTSQTPPEDIITMNGGIGDYPSTCAYHEQRRWFGGTNNKPKVLFATRPGTEANLTTSLFAQDSDAMEIKMAATQYNQIRHLVSLGDLLVFTAGGEYRIYAEGQAAITPAKVSIKPQGYSGASNVQPVVTSASVLYVQAQGARVREISYSWESNNYKSVDVSIMAPHRFDSYVVKQLAYQRAPDQLLWAVRDDGVLACMTYVPDQQVYGWHFHDTDGYVESVCTVAEGNEDAMYLVVKRTIDGRDVRYIERMRTRLFDDQEDAYRVDCGYVYDDTSTSTISGLWHLEGAEVEVLADGAKQSNKTVTGGSITLDAAASVVHVGLGYTFRIQTLPLALEGAPAAGQGTMKNVNKVHLRVSKTSDIYVGPDLDNLRLFPARLGTTYFDTPGALLTEEISMGISPSWNHDAGIWVEQSGPLPITVMSMTLEMQPGG